MSTGWLKCDVFKGMFSDEVAIRVIPKQGEATSFFVARDQVIGEVDGEGKVRVKVYHDGQTSWAVLPTEYSDNIPVQDSDLVPA